MVNSLATGFKTELEILKKDGAVIGISGGIDSAVVLKLLEQCLPKDKILPVIIPERDSNPKCMRMAKKLCLDYDSKIISITPILEKLGIYRDFKNYFFIPRGIKEKYSQRKFRQSGKDIYLRILDNELDPDLLKALGYIRIKNRVRMAIIYHQAEIRNYAVVGTINKTEYLLGFFVPFGDGVADLMPLLNFYKTDVYKIARELEVPEEIINQAPSPDLIPGLSDGLILGMSYQKIDRVLKGIEQSENLDTASEEYKCIEEIFERAKRLRALLFTASRNVAKKNKTGGIS
ncbi:NAD(+) synthase [candidate division WOR-3 bacterium]|nr:NAD(+) synthase [candidate division WOR-3 bacterium]